MTGLFLNFGAGPNQLPEPWQNLNAAHDIRKPLRFSTGTVQGILAEHVVEHVSFLQGVAFLTECLRVLAPGGVLRVCFPDVCRFVGRSVPAAAVGFTIDARIYAERMAARAGVVDLAEIHAEQWHALARKEMLQMLTGWGHQMAWTECTVGGVLCALGYSKVHVREYGEGALAGVDGHHKDVGDAIAQLETTILEATK